MRKENVELSFIEFDDIQVGDILELKDEYDYLYYQVTEIADEKIFAHNPDIFILDEATANIDTYTENLIQKSIDKLSGEKTAIFIAHRLSTIVNVDKIIVLNQGRIIEQGNHKELVNSGGYYSKLYNAYYESLGSV